MPATAAQRKLLERITQDQLDIPAIKRMLADAGEGATIADVGHAPALMADDLRKVPEAVALSKATLANIRQNVVIALLTVAALLAGVLLDRVHMAGGMLIHQASVLVVIFNGMRLLKKQ